MLVCPPLAHRRGEAHPAFVDKFSGGGPVAMDVQQAASPGLIDGTAAGRFRRAQESMHHAHPRRGTPSGRKDAAAATAAAFPLTTTAAATATTPPFRARRPRRARVSSREVERCPAVWPCAARVCARLKECGHRPRSALKSGLVRARTRANIPPREEIRGNEVISETTDRLVQVWQPGQRTGLRAGLPHASSAVSQVKRRTSYDL